MDLKVIASGCSALSVNHAKADLSKRIFIKRSKGIVKRVLKFKYGIVKIKLKNLKKCLCCSR